MRSLICVVAILVTVLPASAVSKFDFVAKVPAAGDFRIVDRGVAADIYVAPTDWECDRVGAEDLAHDIEMVTGVRPKIRHTPEGLSGHVILIGTLGRSDLIDQLAGKNKIAAGRIRDKWEGSLVQVVENPLAGVARALVLAGSDRRGTKYAIYEVSDNIGVSPYFKLNNVLPPHRARLYVKAGTLCTESSFVKYRGSFADDNRADAGTYMEPDAEGRLDGGWAAKRGGWTTQNYIAYGEWDALIRSKGNTYFPCEGLYTNIPFNNLPDANDVLIDQYGLIRSGGHLLALLTTWVNEFPLWLKSQGYDPKEPFYYKANHDRVVQFWQHSIDQNKKYEILWPLGLRGANDHDYREPGVADIPELVRQATEEQARMLAQTPGLASRDMVITGWSGDYGVVDNGKVPPGTAYLFSDGALPGAGWFDVDPLVTDEQRGKNPRAKWGAYFHDSVKTGTIMRVARDQSPGLAQINREFNMLLDHGMNYVWEVNNGPYKGRQYAEEYIAAMGRDPDYWRDPLKVDEFVNRVMKRDFGEAQAPAIARIFWHMDTLNLINYGTLRRANYGIGVSDPQFYPDPYSIFNFGDEYAQALDKLQRDLADAYAIQAKLEPQQRDGFWETIIWPLKLHLDAMRQHYYGYKANLAWKQGRRSARVFLADMEKAAEEVSLNALDYQTLHGGFWYGWTQDDPREWNPLEPIWGHNSNQVGMWYHEFPPKIGTYDLTKFHAQLQKMVSAMQFKDRPAFDINVEGGEGPGELPIFSTFNRETRFFDIGNKGDPPFLWSATASKPWIHVSPARGEEQGADTRVWVSIDWDRVPPSERDLAESIKVDAGPAGEQTVTLRINNPKTLRPQSVEGHVEVDGYLSVAADHYWKKIDRGGAAWRETRISFSDGGKSMYSYPLTKTMTSPSESPELVYRLNFQNPGRYYLNFCIYDHVQFKNFYFALDQGRPVLVDSNYPLLRRDEHQRNIPVNIDQAGVHELHVYMRDPGVVIDQIVFTRAPADFGNFTLFIPVPESDPKFRAAVAPESFHRLPKANH